MTTRPVAQLYPLEVQDGKKSDATVPVDIELSTNSVVNTIDTNTVRIHSVRAAASKANEGVEYVFGPAPKDDQNCEQYLEYSYIMYYNQNQMCMHACTVVYVTCL